MKTITADMLRQLGADEVQITFFEETYPNGLTAADMEGEQKAALDWFWFIEEIPILFERYTATCAKLYTDYQEKLDQVNAQYDLLVEPIRAEFEAATTHVEQEFQDSMYALNQKYADNPENMEAYDVEADVIKRKYSLDIQTYREEFYDKITPFETERQTELTHCFNGVFIGAIHKTIYNTLYEYLSTP